MIHIYTTNTYICIYICILLIHIYTHTHLSMYVYECMLEVFFPGWSVQPKAFAATSALNKLVSHAASDGACVFELTKGF